MEDELTDEQWMTTQPLVPRQTGPGKPRADDRETFDAILYVMSTGCRWESKRTDYSHHYTTAWRRLKRWEEDTRLAHLEWVLPRNHEDGRALDRQHYRPG